METDSLMNPYNIALTGIPRSGTTLTCYLLNKLPNTVALHEPINVEEFFKHSGSPTNVCEYIRYYFGQTRASIIENKTAISKHLNGNVPDNPISDRYSSSGLRESRISKGNICIEKELPTNFFLAIKHPPAFTALLPTLIQFFPVYASIRNPLSVLSSWNSVNIAIREGQSPTAEKLDNSLAKRLEKISNKIERQISLLSWFYEQYKSFLPKESILRYEETISSEGKSLSIIIPEAISLNEPLENKNLNDLYDRELMLQLGERLLNTDGAFWEFYAKADVEALLANIERSPTSRLKQIQADLARSQTQLEKVRNALEQQKSQQLLLIHSQQKQSIPPSLAFITCIEKGFLEAQSLLLYESIRLYGGCFSQSPIYAFSPRAGHSISTETKQRLEKLSVTYIDLPLNSELTFFPSANKCYACAYMEENTSFEFLVWLDSDTLFLREPVKFLLPSYIDVGVRPVGARRTYPSTNIHDAFGYCWRELCHHCQVEYESIPFIETFGDRVIIKSCYNSGLVVGRTTKGIFRRWLENTLVANQQGFYINGNKKESNNHPTFLCDQPTLSMAIWGLTERVQILEPVYNYPLRSIDSVIQPPTVFSSHYLVHIHYHRMFNSENLLKNPLLQDNFEMEEDFKAWLSSRIPLT